MKKFHVALVFILILLICPKSFAASWYIDNEASGLNNGTSWKNAWSGFNQVIWGAGGVDDGDNLYISGGTTSKSYTAANSDLPLVIGHSGASESSRVTISVGQESGHNGIVILDGGGALKNVIIASSKAYFNISGQIGSGQECNLRIKGGSVSGINISGASHHFRIHHVDVMENGPPGKGNTAGIIMRLSFRSDWQIEIDHCKIHDNACDQLNLLQTNPGEGTQYGTFLIHDNDIYNIHDDGIETSLPMDIYNNKFHERVLDNIGHPDVMQFYNSYMRIFNNTIYNILNDNLSENAGIFCDPFHSGITLNPKNIQIFNNLIYETKKPYRGSTYRGIALKFAEPGIQSARNILVANNTIIGIPFTAMMVTFRRLARENVKNIVIENNIFKNNARSGWGSACLILEKGDGSITYGAHANEADVTFDYNNIYASSGLFTTDIQLGGRIVSYSRFKSNCGCQGHDAGSPINPQLNYFFNLQPNSPCLDAGINIKEFSIDHDGRHRPQGLGWDMGAYEYGNAAVNNPKNLYIIDGGK